MSGFEESLDLVEQEEFFESIAFEDGNPDNEASEDAEDRDVQCFDGAVLHKQIGIEVQGG